MHTDSLNTLLSTIIYSDTLHAKWLNTLSYLENCGARKIAACQHPTKVKEDMLKHASEEFRHAHTLKRQIKKVAPPLEDYALHTILGGSATLQYLNALDLQAARYLKHTIGLSPSELKSAAYLPELTKLPHGNMYAKVICGFERVLYEKWLDAICLEVLQKGESLVGARRIRES